MIFKPPPRGRARVLGALALGCLALFYCRAAAGRSGAEEPAKAPPPEINAPGSLEILAITIETARGAVIPLKVEAARTQAERNRGLMRRPSLAAGEGMLFVFDRDQVLHFWMKNTVIPLSIAFISSAGEVLEIRDMAPLDLTGVTSSRSARYALEVPQGWFSQAGIAPGDYARLP
ncbi:MAG: DUF192 domain-containing protein [Treponema sp.]|jgi:uncharacterized membrane protein (UPF0127 family)|nr:DUF192 domain-containing protein [Treponema sp.]